MKELKYLFTLHTNEDEFRIKAAVLARNPVESASLVGGEYIPREGGICELSVNPDEFGLCGTIRFAPELFRELDETDRTLAGLFLGSVPDPVCYTRGVGLLTTRGNAVELVLRRKSILLPEQT